MRAVPTSSEWYVFYHIFMLFMWNLKKTSFRSPKLSSGHWWARQAAKVESNFIHFSMPSSRPHSLRCWAESSSWSPPCIFFGTRRKPKRQLPVSELINPQNSFCIFSISITTNMRFSQSTFITFIFLYLTLCYVITYIKHCLTMPCSLRNMLEQLHAYFGPNSQQNKIPFFFDYQRYGHFRAIFSNRMFYPGYTAAACDMELSDSNTSQSLVDAGLTDDYWLSTYCGHRMYDFWTGYMDI